MSSIFNHWKKEGFANETCGTLFFEIERILKEKKPKAFMLENVRNLTAHDGGNTFKVIKEHLETLGYTVYAKVLNALDYGVPQKGKEYSLWVSWNL